jgi:hypothetical protein
VVDIFQDDNEREKRVAKYYERIQNRELNDLNVVLKISEGRRFIWRFLSAAKLFESGFCEDPNRLYFDEGQETLP